MIRSEFVLGAVLLPALGIGALVATSGATWKVFGVWLIGAGLNYVPFVYHAVSLSRGHALRAALDWVDVHRELLHYTKAQVWVFVPLRADRLDLACSSRALDAPTPDEHGATSPAEAATTPAAHRLRPPRAIGESVPTTTGSATASLKAERASPAAELCGGRREGGDKNRSSRAKDA